MFDAVIDLQKVIDQIKITGEPIDSETILSIVLGSADDSKDPKRKAKLETLRILREKMLGKIIDVSGKIDSKLGKLTEDDIHKMSDPLGILEMRENAKKDLEKKVDEAKKRFEEMLGTKLDFSFGESSKNDSDESAKKDFEKKVDEAKKRFEEMLGTKLDFSFGESSKNDSDDNVINPKIYGSGKKNEGISEETSKKLVEILNLDETQSKKLIELTEKNSSDQLNILGKISESVGIGGFVTVLAATIVGLLFGHSMAGLMDKIFGTHLQKDIDSVTTNIKQYSGFAVDSLKILWMAYTAATNTVKLFTKALFSPLKTLTTIGKAIGTTVSGAASAGSRAIASISALAKPKVENVQKMKSVENPWIKDADGNVKFKTEGKDSMGRKTLRTKEMWENEHGVSADKFKGIEDARIKIPIKQTAEELAAEAEKTAAVATEKALGKSIGKQALKGVAKVGLGGLLKAGLGAIFKKIPIIGALVDFATAISDIRNGDYVGATLRTIGGIASLISMTGVGAVIGIPLMFAVDFLDDMLTQKAGGDPAKKSFKQIPDIVGTLIKSIADWAVGIMDTVIKWFIPWWKSSKKSVDKDVGVQWIQQGRNKSHGFWADANGNRIEHPDEEQKTASTDISSAGDVEAANELVMNGEIQDGIFATLKRQSGLDKDQIKNLLINYNKPPSITDVSKLNDISSSLPKSFAIDGKSMSDFTNTLSNTFMNLNRPTPSLSMGNVEGDESIITSNRGDQIYMTRTKWFNRSMSLGY